MDEKIVKQQPSTKPHQKPFWHVPPGVGVAVLAISAFVYTLIPVDQLTPLSRALWIAAVGMLCAAEIGAIYRARDRQDADYARDRELSQDRFSRTISHLEAINTRSSITLELAQSINDPAGNLKRRALEVAESLVNFISYREIPNNFARLFVTTEETKNEQARLLKHDMETVKLFKSKIFPDIDKIVKELAEHGIVDEKLNELYQNLWSPLSLGIVAERLLDLAKQYVLKTV